MVSTPDGVVTDVPPNSSNILPIDASPSKVYEAEKSLCPTALRRTNVEVTSVLRPGARDRTLSFNHSVEAHVHGSTRSEIIIEEIIDAAIPVEGRKLKASNSPIREILDRRGRYSMLERNYDRETFIIFIHAAARWKALILHLDLQEENHDMVQRRFAGYGYFGPPWSTKMNSWPVVQVGEQLFTFDQF